MSTENENLEQSQESTSEMNGNASFEDTRPIDDPEVTGILNALTEGSDEPFTDQDCQEQPQLENTSPTLQAEPAVPKTPEQEDAEVLSEVLSEVKSERGQNRIRELFNERKDLREVHHGITDIVQQANLTPDAWANIFEFSRLVSSGDDNSLRLALNILENHRSSICKRLGVAAPGIDPLDDFPDLRQRVEAMDMPPDAALELAKLRRHQEQQRATAMQQQQEQQFHYAQTQELKKFQEEASTFLRQRSSDPDYRARERQMEERFRRPGFLQKFVNTYAPHQWLPQLEFMYENISVPQPKPTIQPLRSRPQNFGGVTSPQGGEAYLNSVIDSMGI